MNRLNAIYCYYYSALKGRKICPYIYHRYFDLTITNYVSINKF